jgi:6-pyruvoyltetrahydropterin/6-carboxytetrahydropterin synthase
MKLIHEFQFAAAHHLTQVPPGHKCASPHGHTYTVRVELLGDVLYPEGWVIDFA